MPATPLPPLDDWLAALCALTLAERIARVGADWKALTADEQARRDKGLDLDGDLIRRTLVVAWLRLTWAAEAALERPNLPDDARDEFESNRAVALDRLAALGVILPVPYLEHVAG